MLAASRAQSTSRATLAERACRAKCAPTTSTSPRCAVSSPPRAPPPAAAGAPNVSRGFLPHLGSVTPRSRAASLLATDATSYRCTCSSSRNCPSPTCSRLGVASIAHR
eukprot:4970887-Prymnesium_polylepis.2